MQFLQKKFATLQTQAVAYRLGGLKPSDRVRCEDEIRHFTESTCYSCLIKEVTDTTTSDVAYDVNLLDTGVSVAQKIIDDQMAATFKKRDTVTLEISGYDDKLSDVVRYSDTHLQLGETLEVVNVMPPVS